MLEGKPQIDYNNIGKASSLAVFLCVLLRKKKRIKLNYLEGNMLNI